MAKQPAADGESLTEIVGGIVGDAERLVGQHVDLLRAEVGQAARTAAGAGLSMAAGGGMVAAGGLTSGLAAVHLLQRTTKLPLWACYGLVAGGLGAAGVYLVRAGQRRLTGIRLMPPPETAKAVAEDAEWLRTRTNPTT